MDNKIAKSESTAFARFKQLTARLVAVPKEEVDEKEQEYKAKRQKSKSKKTRGQLKQPSTSHVH